MPTEQEIQNAFDLKCNILDISKSNNEKSGHLVALQYMVDYIGEKIWFWSWEFCQVPNSQGDFLSHRGPARAADLAKNFPHLVEKKPYGKLMAYRLKYEKMDSILALLNYKYE